jgi:predicted nucleic acid-binding protein
LKVIDASVLVPALTGRGEHYRRAIEAMSGTELAAPELVDLEVVSALRRMVRSAVMSDPQALAVLNELAVIPLARASHLPFATRVWELRNNLSAYDASYVALAEALDASLLTADARLASAPAIRCDIELIA